MSGGGQSGGRCDQVADDAGQGELGKTAAMAIQNLRQLQLPGGCECGGDMTVRQCAFDGDRFAEVLKYAAALEQYLQRFNYRYGKFGEIGESFVSDSFSFAPGAPEQVLRGAVSVGDFVDAHAASYM